MDQPYSVWADMLSKFHTSSEWIQALWLIVVPALVFGVTWCVTRLVRDVVIAALHQGPETRSLHVQDSQWRLIQYDNEARPQLPPPSFRGRAAEPGTHNR